MFQMKEPDKIPEEELNEVKISNLSNKEFKLMIIKILSEHRRRVDEHYKTIDYKTLRKENQDDTNKWKDTLCS